MIWCSTGLVHSLFIFSEEGDCYLRGTSHGYQSVTKLTKNTQAYALYLAEYGVSGPNLLESPDDPLVRLGIVELHGVCTSSGMGSRMRSKLGNKLGD